MKNRLVPILFVATCCASYLNAQDPPPLPGGGEATPVESITLPAGFQVQLVRSARAGEGSWISMTFDDRGRLILGRDVRGIVRLTLSPGGDGVERFEVLDDELRHCRGVLYAHDSLYVSATDSKGFYRLRDTTGDDQFDDLQLLKSMDYEFRYGHGANQVVLGPDEQIYLVIGNDVAMLDGRAEDSPYRDPQDDHLLIEPRDAVESVRVGTIVRTDPEGQRWEVLAGGFRNQFDLAFNAEGEMFTYDADMEWDVGLPWYRPTRLNHVVSGGEYGWRWGTGKWPTYFADSLPTTLDTALGSPTGLVFGTESNFPPPYRESLYMGDWQNGRILRVTLAPQGATYTADYDVFLHAAALNVCDMAFGPDQAMYFITGGRRSQSGLYRVAYASAEDVAVEPGGENVEEASAAEATRQLRRQLEAFHRQRDPRAIPLAWPHLASDDRWLRFAARLAVERQDPRLWRQKALEESRPTASIAALLALARLGQPSDQSQLLGALNRLPLAELSREQLLDALRVMQLSFIRQGSPSPEDRAAVLEKLNGLFPHPDGGHSSRELFRLLVYLDAPEIVPRAVDRITSAVSQEDAIFYAQHLARVAVGWSPETRDKFFAWLQQARSYRGGNLLPDALKHIHADAVATLTEEQRRQLAGRLQVLADDSETNNRLTLLPVVQEWKMEDFDADWRPIRPEATRERGEAALAKAHCLRCHRFGDEGGLVGPDLTHVGRHFDERALLESILQPSKVIDEKYLMHCYVLDTGKVVCGRPIGVNAATITLETDAMTGDSVPVPRDQIVESHPSTISPMPEGLADVLTKEELFDLIALLKTGVESKPSATGASAGP